MSLPITIPESQATPFNFYRDGHIYKGMTFNGKLYKRVRLYSADHRLKAFDDACDLSVGEGDAVITTRSVSDGYTLWVDVRVEADCLPMLELPLGQDSENRRPATTPKSWSQKQANPLVLAA